jgi:serine/threonine protein kinase
MIQHLRCRRIREKDIVFDSHMSGFVYKVQVDGHTLIKKEIPGRDTVDEFLYEVNALNALNFSSSVIAFYGVVVDDKDEKVKGLLIDYASQGALIDIIYDSQEHGLPLTWETREKWARQIVQGLSDVHEAGFVQGDFTLSNIVIDEKNNAKIIDINRRGCPVGWEPPEATPLIESNQRISMYIGVKSDLYQLGMVLWALATLEDEPEAHRRPLHLDPEIEVPDWYRKMVENCLHENPRVRLQATTLLAMFPIPVYSDEYPRNPESISVDDGRTVQQYVVDGSYEHSGRPFIRTVTPQSDIYYLGMGYHSGVASPGLSDHYPPRGRSPPSPGPSNRDENEAPCHPRNFIWSTGSAGSRSTTEDGLGESQATTPKDTQSVAATEGMESHLDPSRARSQGSAYRYHSVSEASESIDLTPSSSVPPTPEIVIEPVDEEPSHDTLESSRFHEQTQARGPLLSEEVLALADKIMSTTNGQAEGTQQHVEETDEQEDVGARAIPPLVPMAPESRLFEGDDDDDLDSKVFVHNGSATAQLPATSQVSPTPEQQFPTSHGPTHESDLTGIGAGYGAQEDRQAIFSDEDLGITSSSHTNVASQA